MDTTDLITVDAIQNHLLFNDVFALDDGSSIQFNQKKNNIDNFSTEFAFCTNGYQTTKVPTNDSLAIRPSTVIDNILLDKAMIPEIDIMQPYIHDTITDPVLPSYQANYKFVNGLAGTGDANDKIDSIPVLKDSNDVLYGDVVDPKQTVLPPKGCARNPMENIDYSMDNGDDYAEAALMVPNNQHKPLETVLIPLTPIESMNNPRTNAAGSLLVKNSTKMKNKRPRQTKEKSVTITGTKKRKSIAAKTKTSDDNANVPFLSFAPENDSIDQINALQSDNSTIFPMAITAYNSNGNGDNLLSTDTGWTAYNVPASFNISAVNLNNVTEAKSTLVHISQITQADLLNCLYQEPSATVTSEHLNCIDQSVSDNLINANFQPFSLAEPGKSDSDEHQLIVCNASMMTKASSDDWTNDCHSIIRSPSILPQINDGANQVDSNREAAESANATSDDCGSFVLQSDGKAIVYHDLQQNKQILYQIVAPKAKKKSEKKASHKEGKIRKMIIKRSENTKTVAKPRRRRGRPRKDEVKRTEEEHTNDEKSTTEPSEELPCSRTRYGRLSRPPKHMSKFIDVKEHLAPPIPENTNIVSELFNKITGNQLLKIDEKVNEDLPKSLPEPVTEQTSQSQPIQSEIKKKRNIDRFKCGICKKVYLGKNKMFKHLQAFPDHKDSFQEYMSQVSKKHPTVSTTATNSQTEITIPSTLPVKNSLYEELINRVQNEPKENRLDYFVNELADFSKKIQQLTSNLLTTQNANTSVKYVNARMGKMLNLQEGNYQFNTDLFDDVSNLKVCHFNGENAMTPMLYDASTENANAIEPMRIDPEQSTDYNINMLSLDGISDSKLNLVDGMCEESLLMHLVDDRINGLSDEALHGTEPPVNLDHLNDNAVGPYNFSPSNIITYR